jgi:hypothetical protein
VSERHPKVAGLSLSLSLGSWSRLFLAYETSHRSISDPRPALLQTMETLLPVLVLLLVANVQASVNFPGVEYNAALDGAAMASSHYSFSPNALLDATFVPENAADGLPDTTSWWAAGNAGEDVFWQVNLSSPVPRAARVVVRWHGFLSPTTFRVRVSYNGEVFTTVAVVRDRPLAFDRVDNVTDGFEAAKAFRFLRLVMDAANVCADEFSCDGNATTSSVTTNERVIYGIRELELWARGNKNGRSSGPLTERTKTLED